MSFKNNSKEPRTVTPSGVAVAEQGNIIEMGDITLTIPENMKYGTLETNTGHVYYVWCTNEQYILPTDLDIILYIYTGIDTASPDGELTDSEARYSIAQNYMQVFRENVDGRISADPSVVSNNDWYILQLTGYSGNYLTTSYGTMCYPKYYYGVYVLEKTTDDYKRNYYGFVFSNDSMGAIIDESNYNAIYNQIKKAFSITEFYSAPMVEYDETKDYSKGYSYKQFVSLFSDTMNYYGMSAQQSIEIVGETEESKVKKD